MAQPTAEVRAARRRLRALRLGIEPRQRTAAEAAIRATLDRLRIFRRGGRVALYLPLPGEVDLRSCLPDAWRCGAETYVPRIVSRRRRLMTFVALAPGSTARLNRYGIEEPVAATRCIGPVGLDVVLVPVVGYDRRGNRLGMGAGYYDRVLRRRLDPTRRWRRPRLVGVAFACQELDAIPASPWDVPLDLIVTERGLTVPERRPDPEHTR
ncbi:MAG TPA: 5-formyltetrahydrofolate cyclo-ligase [Steroidobacteraceae bacterium]|nr:5-formyltetrahydrofolate cyclo-ligase [Steroidobacteraceae bacterium]